MGVGHENGDGTHVVYSHSHGDHIGVTSIYPEGVTIIAHEETKAILARGNPCLGCAGPRPAPTQTFADSLRLEVGNQVLERSYKGVNHNLGNIFI